MALKGMSMSQHLGKFKILVPKQITKYVCLLLKYMKGLFDALVCSWKIWHKSKWCKSKI